MEFGYILSIIFGIIWLTFEIIDYFKRKKQITDVEFENESDE